MSQRRYLPLGSTAPQSTWVVPVCMRFGTGDTTQRQCWLLDKPSAEFALDGGVCPEWLHPNENQMGYYRWSLPETHLLKLVADTKHLSSVERSVLPYQLTALFEAGALSAPVFMQALGDLARRETHWLTMRGIVSGMHTLKRVVKAKPADLGLLSDWVRKVLQAASMTLGKTAKEGEPASDSMARPTVIRTLASIGQDAAVLADARETVDAYLTDEGAVALDRLSTALPTVARHGDAALWQMLRGRALNANSPTLRSTLVRSLGVFEDPKLLVRSLDLILDGSLRGPDLRSVMRGVDAEPAMHAAFAWMVQNYDQILVVVGKSSAAHLPGFGRGFCTARDAAVVKAFFEQPEKNQPGTARNLALVLESIDECARIRAAHIGAVGAVLRKAP